jgi:peptidoglycan-N-acetylglucosamine deacetylase
VLTLLRLSLLLLAVDGGTPAAIDSGVLPPPPPPPPPTFAIRSVATSEPVVALTFDACATKKQPNGFDRKVWDVLAGEQIPVTFYLAGRWVETHKTAAKVIAAAPFIELGNHSYSHPRLTLLRKDRLRAQIRYTNRILERKLGRRPLSLRPPAGAWDRQVVRAANEENLPVVTWSVVSGDVGGHVPPERMVSSVLDQAKPGAIIIFHINRREPFTKNALPDIIAGLREKGFRFVTISQLLALADATPEPAKPSRWGFGVRRKTSAPPPACETPAPPPPGEDLAHPPT